MLLTIRYLMNISFSLSGNENNNNNNNNNDSSYKAYSMSYP